MVCPIPQGDHNNLFNSRTTRASRCQKNIHSLTPSLHGYSSQSLINFLYLLQSIASSLFNCASGGLFYNLIPAFVFGLFLGFTLYSLIIFSSSHSHLMLNHLSLCTAVIISPVPKSHIYLGNTHLMAPVPGQPSKPAPEGKTILCFNEATSDGAAVASAGPYANHLHLTVDR